MKPLQSAYWAVGCWLVLTFVAYGLDPLFRSGRHTSMEKRYVDQVVQDFEIQKTESYAALTRQQLIDRWLPLANNYELVPASLTPVTDRSPTRSSALLDRGVESGLRSGLGVVSESGVVGRIVESGDGWSRLQLADDAGFVTPFVDEDGSRGILSGSLSPQVARLKMRLDPMTFSLNERLFTDGSGGIFPAGVYLGAVVEPRTPIQSSKIILPLTLGLAQEVIVFLPIRTGSPR